MRFSVFLSGVVIMALEIVVGRLLTPYYGDGVTVWGAIIGVLLCALALGHYLGGFFADKKILVQHIQNIFISIFLFSGIYILCIPFLVRYFSSTHILFLSFLILTPPIMLLGMISPLVLTISTTSLKHLGMNAGTIYALGTFGSIVGTFGTVFGLFQFFTLQQIFPLLAGVCAVGVLSMKTSWRFLGVVLCIICLMSYPKPTIAFETEVDEIFPSVYGEIHVKDLAGTRHVSINTGHMSEVNISNRTQQLYGWDYLYCMEAPFLVMDMNKPIVLTIGLGAGYYQNKIHELYDAKVEAVEINPVMVEVARTYFGYDLPVHIGDGRKYLEDSKEVYDVISLDVMQYSNFSYRVPKEFVTKEFFTLAQEKLTNKGFFVIHIPTEQTTTFFLDTYVTLKNVFPYVTHYDCAGGQVLVAKETPFAVRMLEQYLQKNTPNTSLGRVLTDDFFPTI